MTVRYAVTLTSPDIYLASPPVKGTTDWTRVTRTFTTAPNYQAGRLDLLYNVNTGATAWFDDVSLCEGTQACL